MEMQIQVECAAFCCSRHIKFFLEIFALLYMPTDPTTCIFSRQCADIHWFASNKDNISCQSCRTSVHLKSSYNHLCAETTKQSLWFTYLLTCSPQMTAYCWLYSARKVWCTECTTSALAQVLYRDLRSSCRFSLPIDTVILHIIQLVS